MLVDLHVHTGPGALDPAAVLARAPSLGLDGVAFVGEGEFPDLTGLRDGPVRAFAGAEVATDRGHYLVFLPEPQTLPPLADLLGPRTDAGFAVRDVLARVRALGGAVVAAHPYDANVPHPGGDIIFTLPTLSAVETVNGRHTEHTHPAIEAAETMGLPCTGGSDARTSLDEVGRAATLFTRSLADEAALVSALRSGACWPVEFGTPPADLARRRPQPPREFSGPPGGGAPQGGGSPGGSGRRRRRR